MRAHLHLPITDASGNVYPYATVSFNDPSTGAPTAEPVFVQSSGGNPVSQPLFCDPAVIDVWTDNAVRVQIVATVAGNVRVQLEGIDIAPAADLVMQAPQPVRISGAGNITSTTVLASLGPNDASFQVADPVGTHQHSGDSAGSVVLTGEDPSDFDPYQTWIGYHAGENSASASSGSTAIGPHAVLDGTSATILGVGEVALQTSTGATGDYVTIISSEDSNATLGSTSVGAANLLRQGQSMTVVGSLNGPMSPTAVPNGATGVGSGNDLGAAGAVKIGANHPTSTAGANQTVIGIGNIAQSSGLPWASGQKPTAVGSNITLAGDPSNNASTDDWFGGVGPLAIGTNSTAFNPSLLALQGSPATNALLRTLGDTTVNGALTYSNTTVPLSFYGGTPTTSRQKIGYQPTDVYHQLLQDVLNALGKTGLILTQTVPTVTESGTHPNGTALEFAETGQALQWKLPATSPTYTATNPFTVASNKVTVVPGRVAYPYRGVPALYSAGHRDSSVSGRFTFNPTGTNLITNPGFETDTVGWGTYDSDTIARDTTRARYGAASLKVTPSGTLVAARTSYGINGLTAGTTYNFSAWVYPTAAWPVRIGMDGYTSGFAYTGTFAQANPVPPVNQWSRVSVVGTVPSGSPNVSFNVGYFSTTTNPLSSTPVWIDGAQVTTGASLLPLVDNSGYAPDDYFTGLMFRSYNATSVVSGNTIAIPSGYLMGRKNVYAMSGNTITSTLATLSSIPASGDLLQIQSTGTALTFMVNGSTVASLTDTLFPTRVKYGFRVTETTSAYGFSAAPLGL